MKRTPLTRKTPLKAGKPLRKRGSRPKRFAHRRDPDYAAWIRTQGCFVMTMKPHAARCSGPIEAAHVKSRGAGGDDVGNLLPLCRHHHQIQHRLGIRSFPITYGLGDLRLCAQGYAWLYRHQQPEVRDD